MNVEGTAVSLLKRGVELDAKERYTESLICYQEGIQILVDSLKTCSIDKRNYYRSKIEEYMNRAELIKKKVNKLKDEGKYHEQIAIENDSIGNSYVTLFGRFLNEDVMDIKIEDPYIRAYHQCQNLIRFCELLVSKCKNLKQIKLITTKDSYSNQQNWLEDLQKNLVTYGVVMDVSYSGTLHDRAITLSTGWIIKIGRGLDYFKSPDSKFALGVFDLNLRRCHETTIDIFHTNNVKHSVL